MGEYPDGKIGGMPLFTKRNQRYVSENAERQRIKCPMVRRWIVTYVSPYGFRTGVLACQARNTFATRKEAETWIEACRANNSASVLAMFGAVDGKPDTLAPLEVDCWANGGDPVASFYELIPGGRDPADAMEVAKVEARP